MRYNKDIKKFEGSQVNNVPEGYGKKQNKYPKTVVWKRSSKFHDTETNKQTKNKIKRINETKSILGKD